MRFHIYTIATLLLLTSLLLGCEGCVGCGGEDKEVEPIVDVDTVRRVTIIFGGDVMQHLPQIVAAKRDTTYDYSDTFQYLKPLFDSTDLVVVSLETTISADQNYSGYPMFASPHQLMDAVKESGVDAVMLANNHIADKGREGIRATIYHTKRVGLKHSGVFADSADYRQNNPLILEANNFRFAILNYTYGTNGMPIPEGTVINLIDTTQIALDLEKIDRQKVDHTIIVYHWGDEYSYVPTQYQKSLAKWTHSKGVDFVIGSHPHVILPTVVERNRDGEIVGATAYSLGNLVSNQRWRRSDGGMLLRVEITKTPSTSTQIDISYILTWVHNPYIEGKSRYIVLPSPVADTLLRKEHNSVAQYHYNRFIEDSRKVLGSDSTLYELFPPRPM